MTTIYEISEASATPNGPPPFAVDELSPPQFAVAAHYIHTASLDDDTSGIAPPRWVAFVSIVVQLIAAVRDGHVRRQETGEFLRNLSRHYFDYDTPPPSVVDGSIRAFASATRRVGR